MPEPQSFSEHKQSEALLDGQRQVLQLIAEGATLSSILDTLTRIIEAQSNDGLLASILLLDQDGEHLRHGAGPSLPQSYRDAIDGVKIGPSVGSCGTAAFRREPVIVSDIEADPLWFDFRELALSSGLRSCWSTPILAQNGGVLGTFAIYYRQQRLPTERDLQLISLVTRTAAVAIERIRSQEELQRSHAQLLNTLDRITDGFVALDDQWRFTYLNRRAQEIFRKMLPLPEQLLGKNVWEALPELVGSQAEQEYRRAAAEQQPVTFEFFYPGLDGWFEIHTYPSPNGLSIYFHDITARKTALVELQNQRRWLEEALNLLPTPTLLIEPDTGRVNFANHAADVLAGGEFPKGKPVEEYHTVYYCTDAAGNRIPDEQMPGARVARGERLDSFQMDSHLGQQRRSILLHADTLPAMYGHPATCVVMYQDITKIKQVEIELREQTEIFETINRVGQVLAAELDLNKLVQAVTDAATELIGAQFGSFFYNVIDNRGESYMLYTLSGVPREAFAHFPMPRNTEVFAPTFKGEGIIRLDDVKLDSRYGKSSPFYGMPPGHLPVTSYLAVPVISRTGEVLGGLFFGHSEPAIFTSRGERVVAGLAAQVAVAMDNARLFDEIQKAWAKAEAANRAKDEFLAIVSHELRTPLSAMLGWTRLLKADKLDRDGAKRALDSIDRNARAQVQLIDDLLDVSRIISGKLRLEVRPFDVVTVIEAAIDAVRPAAEAKGIRLQLILDRSAGPVSGDASRLQQVIWNLLSNAIKFTPKEGRVQVKLERINSHLEIIVADTGHGIHSDFLPYVFERFRQADSSITRLHSGLGLGLAIVRHLVEMHGGEVRAESPGEGQGATFTVRLPVLAVHSPDIPADQSEPIDLDIAVAPRLDGWRILVVDDEADARELLTAILEQCGAEVRAVSSAAEAIEAISDRRPDVLVSDIGMPETDGYSLIRQVRALGSEQGGRIPAVALTAYARIEDRMRALAAGFQMHVTKPVEPAELAMVIGSLLHRTGESGRQT